MLYFLGEKLSLQAGWFSLGSLALSFVYVLLTNMQL